MLILTVTISISLNAQQPLNTKNAAVELYMGTEDVSPASKFITFKLDAESPVIGATKVSSTIFNYFVTNNYQHLTYTFNDNNTVPDDWIGYDFVTSKTSPATYPIYGYALYKFSLENSDLNFYIDYRDERIGKYELYSPPTTGHNIDIWIKYNEIENKLYYSSYAPPVWIPIVNGDYLAFWEIKGKGVPVTINFPNGF